MVFLQGKIGIRCSSVEDNPEMVAFGQCLIFLCSGKWAGSNVLEGYLVVEYW